MMSESGNRFPQNILEAFGFFGDPDACIDFVASTRWPIGPKCPRCQGAEHSYLTTRRLWKCKACKRQFSVKVGTIFENSAVPLDKWLSSIWLVANIKDGVSSYELSWWIGVTQKSAWFVLHRIRLAAHVGEFDVFDRDVEVEETNFDDFMKVSIARSQLLLGDSDGFATLIKVLRDPEAAFARNQASDLLEQMSGRKFGYAPDRPVLENQAALKRIEDWWKNEGAHLKWNPQLHKFVL